MTRLGDMLRDARERAKLTQEELGLRIGESQEFISRWERGMVDADVPKVAQCEGLSRELGIPVTTLLRRRLWP